MGPTTTNFSIKRKVMDLANQLIYLFADGRIAAAPGADDNGYAAGHFRIFDAA